MRKVVVTVAVIGLLAGVSTATAAPAPKWRWTEPYTEQILRKNLRIPCKYIRHVPGTCDVGQAQAAVDGFNHAVECNTLATSQQKLNCLLYWNDSLPPEPVDHIAHGYPLSSVPDCVGSGTGVSFALLRCKITVLDHDPASHKPRLLVGRIAVTPTGRTRFRWSPIR